MNAMSCPACRSELDEAKLAHGRFWRCDGCGGRAITVELLRRTFTPESINPLWLHAINHEGQAGRPCPQCAQPMLTVAFCEPDAVPIDVCRLCHLVWFDRGEVEHFVPLPPKPEAAPIPPEERQAAAIAKVTALAEQARAQDYGEVWRRIGRIFGGYGTMPWWW